MTIFSRRESVHRMDSRDSDECSSLLQYHYVVTFFSQRESVHRMDSEKLSKKDSDEQ